MSRTILIGCVLACLILLAPSPGGARADEAAWAALKDGGKVVLLRHSQVDSAGNPLRHEPGNCGVEQNLSGRGREQAKRIGEAFKARGIAVGDVLSSPYCRTMDTGMLAFGKATPAPFLVVPESVAADLAARNTQTALQRIAQHSGPLNLVLISHLPNVEVISLERIEQGELVVLKPRDGRDFDVVGRILVRAP
jgi:phosphohistidine phosphatase SixA